MRESVLAPAFSVSRTTMREALRHLVDEGLVTYHLNRGTVVTDITAADVSDLYAVRLVLEPSAITGATRFDQDLVALLRAARANSRAARRNDVAAAFETDLAVHREIVKLHGSPRMTGLHDDVLGQLRIALNLLDRSHGDQRAQAEEHSLIVRELELGYHDAARELLRAHLERARDTLVSFLTSGEK